MTLEIGDEVQIKAGGLKGETGRVLSARQDGRYVVDIDGATKTYGERSLSLTRALAQIRKGDHVVRRSEPDGPIGRVTQRGALRVTVSWEGLAPLGMDIRQVERLVKREGAIVRDRGPIDRAAILARPVDSLLHSGAVDPLAAHFAANPVTPGPVAGSMDLPEPLRRRGFVKCPQCPTLTTPEHLAAHEATHQDEAPLARPEERVYPLGRPTSDEDPRFKAGLWMDVVRAIEAAGFPPMSGRDMAAVQAMLFRFIYDKGE